MAWILATFMLFQALTAWAQERRKVVAGYSGISGEYLVMWVAQEARIFAKNGLDVQLVYFSGTAAAALISADIAMSYVSGPQVINSVLAGSDITIVAGGLVAPSVWLMSRPEIKTADQLKGKTVAIGRFGAAFDLLTRLVLQRIGLTPMKDVTLVQVGGSAERRAALESGRVQAGLLTHPGTFITQRNGFNVLADFSSFGIPFQHDAVVTTRRFIQKEPEIVRAFVKSQVEAVHRVKKDREFAKRVVVKYLKIQDGDILDKTYDNATTDRMLPRKQYPTLEGIKTILDWVAMTDPKAKGSKPEDFVDVRFIKELDESGFIDGLYK
jgi:NitT/TauT family transport system substrate-binding protein